MKDGIKVFSRNEHGEVVTKGGHGLGTSVLHYRVCTQIALSANEYVARWGMVAAKPDGEDSVGRQKMALLTPSEIVARACDTAQKLFAEFEKRGWLHECPSLDGIRALHDTKEGEG